ncbi:MAG: hypothetical protein KIC77_07760 [Clostridiales bacterium]|jgi:hypothetical protein|nr:hypothetical protein [Clostridiales bacterium]
MTGKFIAYILSVFTFFFILLISISFFLYMGINERVHDICYDVAETVSTKGLISEEIFTYIKSNLSLYGEYELNFILEKHLEENTSVFYYGEEQIKNIPLNRGDRVTISAFDTNPSLFEKITGKELRVSAVKIAIIN